MSGPPISRINYASRDAEFVRENFGLEDPTPGDGVITWEEMAPALRDFYRGLSPKETAALKRFRLSTQSFSQSRELATVARKFVNWRFFQTYSLPPDFDVIWNETDSPKNPGSLIDFLVIDLKSIRKDRALYRLLLEGDLSCLKTITLRILRDFLTANQGKDRFTISRAAWDKAYAIWNCEANPTHTAESTWQEMVSLWHASDPHWHPLMNDTVAGRVTGGRVWMAHRDKTVTASGIRAYAANPNRHILDHPSPHPDSGFSVRHAILSSETQWPDEPTRIPLMKKWGMGLNLAIEPNARLTAYQNVRDGHLSFNVGEPLLLLEGFHLNVDAESPLAKDVAAAGQWLTGLIGRDFDIGLYHLFAVTVYHNRICLVFDGRDGRRDLIDLVNNEDFLFLDVTALVRDWMEGFARWGGLADQLFDEAGDLYSRIPISGLQQVLIDFFRSQTVSGPAGRHRLSLPRRMERHGFKTQFQLRDLKANFSDLIPSMDSEGFLSRFYHVSVSDGRLMATVGGQTDLSVKATLALNIGFENDYLRTPKGDDLFTAQVDIVLEPGEAVGFARVRLPEVRLSGISDGVDDVYAGSVFVALPAGIFDGLKQGTEGLDEILKEVSAHVLLGLTRNHKDYLSAAAYFKYRREDNETARIKELLTHYQAVAAGENQRIHGIISGGRFYELQEVDPDNPYLSQEFTVRSADVAGGGLWPFVAKDVVLKLIQDAAGVWYLEPVSHEILTGDRVQLATQDLQGRIRVEPVLNEAQGVIDLTVPSGAWARSKPVLEETLSTGARGREVATVLNESFHPYATALRDAPPVIRPLAAFDLGSPTTVKAADSLKNLSVAIYHATFYPEGEYKKRPFSADEVALLPLIKGFFGFLNPRVRGGTEFHLGEPELLVKDNRLQDVSWSLSKPVGFLGFRIKGLEIGKPRRASSATARLFMTTENYRINLICLLNLRYPFKMKGFYKRVNRRLAAEGRNVKLAKNEVPRDLGALAIFLDELVKALGWEDKIKPSNLGKAANAAPTDRQRLFDLNHLERVFLQSDLKLFSFDSGIVHVTQDNDSEVSLDVDFRPNERCVEPGRQEMAPYLSVELAHEAGEAVRHVDVNISNRQLFFQGEFDSVAGVRFYLGGPMREGAPMFFSVGSFDSDKDINVFYRPTGDARPAFAMATTDGGHAHQNVIRGGDLFVLRDENGDYLSGVTFHEAHVKEGFLYFTSRDQETGRLRDAFIDQTEAAYQDFKIRLGARRRSLPGGGVDYDFDTIIVRGRLVLADDPGAIPRAYFFTGVDKHGRRRYLELTRVTGDGEVDTEWPRVSYAGNITIVSKIPDQFFGYPSVVALNEQGFDFNLEGVAVMGSLAFTLEDDRRRVTRLDRAEVPGEFIPTALILKGEISFESAGKKITLRDLKIPIAQLDMEIVGGDDLDRQTTLAPIIRNFVIPAGEPVSGDVTASTVLPEKLGQSAWGIADGRLSLEAESGFPISMDDAKRVRLAASGIEARVTDTASNSWVSLKADELYFYDDTGHLKSWRIDARLKGVIRTLIEISLKAGNTDLQIKF